MSANTFGTLFKIHSFGESHGAALGAVIEGCPAGVTFDIEMLESELARRRPGSSDLVSARKEMDQPEILSGVYQGKTLGTPICILVRNQDARSEDYQMIAQAPRAGHADDVWQEKFGHRDPRGGGRSSGRETVSRVLGGAVANMVLKKLSPETKIRGFVRNLGPYELTEQERLDFVNSKQTADAFKARFPSPRHHDIAAALLDIKEKGDSWGGIAEIYVQSPGKSLGQPVFHKLKSDLAAAMMSVGATSAVEIGEGLFNSSLNGSHFHKEAGSEIYGGIRGGISTGEVLSVKVHMKPTSSILDVAKKGRHDPAILIRALPVLESMMSLVLVDHLLWKRLDQIS
jgi:chorismate synthase